MSFHIGNMTQIAQAFADAAATSGLACAMAWTSGARGYEYIFLHKVAEDLG